MKGSARFWRFVDKGGSCWLWKGPTVNGKPVPFTTGYMSAQRFALRDVTDRKVRKQDGIEMTCGNPLCVRPSHMWTVCPVLGAKAPLRKQEAFRLMLSEVEKMAEWAKKETRSE